MSKSVRFALGLAAAAAMTAALVASASARNLSSSNQQFRATWNPMVLTDPFGNTVNCAVTLEGSLAARTIPKVLYTLMGRITEAIVAGERCTGGTATILRETLPWHQKYGGFRGTLPDITIVETLVAGASFRVFEDAVGAACLFTSRDTTREHVRADFAREGGGNLTRVDVSGSITSNEACAFGLRIAGRLSGASRTLTLLNSVEPIRVTLI